VPAEQVERTIASVIEEARVWTRRLELRGSYVADRAERFQRLLTEQVRVGELLGE
jgi:hypothetical protein